MCCGGIRVGRGERSDTHDPHVVRRRHRPGAPLATHGVALRRRDLRRVASQGAHVLTHSLIFAFALTPPLPSPFTLTLTLTFTLALTHTHTPHPHPHPSKVSVAGVSMAARPWLILECADDYSYCMVGDPNRSFLKILAREAAGPDQEVMEPAALKL